MMRQADHDEYDVEDLGALIEEGLNEALASRHGEITLPVYNMPPEHEKRIRAMRKRLGVKSRAAFAEAFGVPEKNPPELGGGAHNAGSDCARLSSRHRS